MPEGDLKLEDFRLMCKLGEGTFSVVLKVKNKKSGKVFAMKRFRKPFKSYDEIETLREIQALRRLNPHKHIIDLEDIIFDPKRGILSLNFELMECNLYELISKNPSLCTEGKARTYMWQICIALEYIHGKGIFHRDIKPENILYRDGNIKIADFGSCRGIHSKQPFTQYIATRWYRSPECLICDGMYNYKMDTWAAGCVLYEMVSKNPMFPGSDELDQLHKIHSVVGTPSTKVLKMMLGPKIMSLKYNFPPKEGSGIQSLIPNAPRDCIDMIKVLLAYNPDDRYSSKDALKHPYFSEIRKEISAAKAAAANTMAISIASKGDIPQNSYIKANNDSHTKPQSLTDLNTSIKSNKQNNSSVENSDANLSHIHSLKAKEGDGHDHKNNKKIVDELQEQQEVQQMKEIQNDQDKKKASEETSKSIPLDTRQYPELSFNSNTMISDARSSKKTSTSEGDEELQNTRQEKELAEKQRQIEKQQQHLHLQRIQLEQQEKEALLMQAKIKMEQQQLLQQQRQLQMQQQKAQKQQQKVEGEKVKLAQLNNIPSNEAAHLYKPAYHQTHQPSFEPSTASTQYEFQEFKNQKDGKQQTNNSIKLPELHKTHIANFKKNPLHHHQGDERANMTHTLSAMIKSLDKPQIPHAPTNTRRQRKKRGSHPPIANDAVVHSWDEKNLGIVGTQSKLSTTKLPLIGGMNGTSAIKTNTKALPSIGMYK